MKLKSILLAIAVSGAAAAPAQAVSFMMGNGGGLGDSQRQKAIQVAFDYWESVLGDDVTINVGFFQRDYGNVPGISSAASAITLVQDVYAGLAKDQTSALDASAVANLQPLQKGGYTYAGTSYDTLTVTTNGFNANRTGYVDETTRIDNDSSGNNFLMLTSKANAQALGINAYNGAVLDDTTIDGYVYYSTTAKYDYDPTDGIDEGAYDFVGFTISSIADILGFESGMATYDTNTQPGATTTANVENYTIARPIDLFRYSDSDVIDWSTSQSDKYFSVDGGDSEFNGESSYHTGVRNGDGGDSGRWKESATGELGINQDSQKTGTGMSVSGLDLAALDAIGWDVRFDVAANSTYRQTTADTYRAMTAVPEPATWLQMLLGFGLIGGVARRRRAGVRVTA